MGHEIRMRFAHILSYAGKAGEALCTDYNKIRHAATPATHHPSLITHHFHSKTAAPKSCGFPVFFYFTANS